METDPQSNDSLWMISVDDHVTEPPDLWTSRLPARFREQAPRVERDRATIRFEGAMPRIHRGDPEGSWADFWVYEDVQTPLMAITNSVGFDEEELRKAYREGKVVTYEEIAPGCWQQGARLDAMSLNHVEASLCFPNIIPRFCGQTFFEKGDRHLGLLCIKAYNDWMIDDWCAGAGKGRLIPLTLIPLWDADLAAAEVRRCAGKGAHAVSFCENPSQLGLPSFYEESNFWDPFFEACQETETMVNLHIGSSSQLPTTSAKAPYVVTSILMFQNSMASILDMIFSGVLDRFPGLTVAYSEGQIGWLPYLIRRADEVWADPHDGGTGIRIDRPPSSYVENRIYGCIFDDDTALRCRDLIGTSQIMFEVDYPHAAGSFPHTAALADKMCTEAGLSASERYQVIRGNAIRAFGLERFGISA